MVLLAMSVPGGHGQTKLHSSSEKMRWVMLSPQDGMADSRRLDMDGGSLEVDVAPAKLDVGEDAVLRHIETAASAIVAYFGRFHVSRARILVVPVPDRGGSPQGTTWGHRGGFQGFTRLRVGEHTTQQDLDNDWVTTHELVHMTFPSQEDEHHWIEEGLATYVEPLARVKTGELTAKSVWTDMVKSMGQGEPRPGDQGLDHARIPGQEPTGAARCFACARMSRFAARPETGRGCKMRCEPLPRRAAQSIRIGLSKRLSQWATRQRERTC